jgi:hypothetical protein
MAYGIPERAAMIALAALGGSAPNAKLKNEFKLDLSGQNNKGLHSDGLITLTQKKRGAPIEAISLTNKGWKWVEDEMGAEVPPRSGSAGGALYALLAGLKPAAERAGGLKALLSAGPPPIPPTPPASDLKDQIRSAYRALAKRPQDWVMLRDLRPHLGNAAKSEVDSTLKRMFLDKEINLTLNDDQGSLTQADRDAAIRIGPNDMHMLSMG